DVLAARPAHPRGEPRVEDLIVRAREQEPVEAVRTRAGDRHHDPGGCVAAAGEAPAPGHPEPATRRRDLPSRWIQTAGKECVGSGGEEFFLGALGEVADPPVVGGPPGVAPGGRAAATTELDHAG